jgi:hypothetical protein
LLFFPPLDYDGTMQKQNEYEQLGRRMDQLAADYGRTHDSKIKAEIQELATKRLEMVEKGEAVEMTIQAASTSDIKSNV